MPLSSPGRTNTPIYVILLSWGVDYIRKAQRINKDNTNFSEIEKCLMKTKFRIKKYYKKM